MRTQVHKLVHASFNPSPAANKVFSRKPLPGGTGGVSNLSGDDRSTSPTPVTVSKPPFAFPAVLQPRVVIYDGVCHLCHSGVKRVIQADKYGKIKFCCVQSKAAEPYLELCEVDREDVLRHFIFIEGIGQCHQASTGNHPLHVASSCGPVAFTCRTTNAAGSPL